MSILVGPPCISFILFLWILNSALEKKHAKFLFIIWCKIFPRYPNVIPDCEKKQELQSSKQNKHNWLTYMTVIFSAVISRISLAIINWSPWATINKIFTASSQRTWGTSVLILEKLHQKKVQLYLLLFLSVTTLFFGILLRKKLLFLVLW